MPPSGCSAAASWSHHSRDCNLRRLDLNALAELFAQLRLPCQMAAQVSLGPVVLNDTQAKASASKHKAIGQEACSGAKCNSRPNCRHCCATPRWPTPGRGCRPPRRCLQASAPLTRGHSGVSHNPKEEHRSYPHSPPCLQLPQRCRPAGWWLPHEDLIPRRLTAAADGSRQSGVRKQWWETGEQSHHTGRATALCCLAIRLRLA